MSASPSIPPSVRWGALSACVLLGLTGCSLDKQLEASFCIEYESAWADFIDVRDGGAVTPTDMIDASRELRERWSALQGREGTPWDIRDLVAVADRSFVSAWNASTDAERRPYQESWINGREYIGLQCANSGFDVNFGGDDVPVKAPRVTEP